MIEELLRNVRRERKELAELKERIADLEDKALPGGTHINDVRVQTSVRADPMGDAVVTYVDVAYNLRKRMNEVTMRIQLAELCIAGIKDPDERRVLRLYYLSGEHSKSMSEVARQIPCSTSTAWAKRAEGVRHSEEYLDKVRTLLDSHSC